jgi:cardiolipin synthase C
VRVRILLDDTTSDGLDQIIATLAAHPQHPDSPVQPAAPGAQHRRDTGHGAAVQSVAQHRRMHNKLWLADNSVAIVGGRNLGDEYFDAEPDLNFTDIDLLSIGPVAEQLGHSFDQYWNSALSQPIGDFVSSRLSPASWPRRGGFWRTPWPSRASKTMPCISRCAPTRPSPAWTCGAGS